MQNMVKIRKVIEKQPILEQVRRLYESSFPEEERRLRLDFQSNVYDNVAFCLYEIVSDGFFGGFLTSWDLGVVRYVEHFAIEPRLRGRGVGTDIIGQFVAMDSRPVVLETELPETGEMARRRIGFYKRCGFEECVNIDYVQPAYASHLPSVPMRLMITDKNNVDVNKVVQIIYRIVYNFE